jgi:hypothetical protein
MVSSKDSDLDKLKTIGDELVQKGRSSVVEPYEKQIYQRWDELEKKLQNTESMLNIKLTEFEEKDRLEQHRQAEKQKQMIANEEVRYCIFISSW